MTKITTSLHDCLLALVSLVAVSSAQAQNQYMEIDIGKAGAIINSYFTPFNHKPTSTNVAVLSLGEIKMIAVVDS